MHAHVILEEDALERQSLYLGAICCNGRSARARSSLRDPLRDKKHEVGRGLSLADTQTGR